MIINNLLLGLILLLGTATIVLMYKITVLK